MSENKIIIDGIDVSEWTDEEIRYNFEKHSPKAIRQIAFDLYKQLARKEQECEKIKTQILLLQTMEIKELKNYKQSLDEIEKYIKNQLDEFGNDVYNMDKSATNSIQSIINKAKKE